MRRGQWDELATLVQVTAAAAAATNMFADHDDHQKLTLEALVHAPTGLRW